MDTCLRGSKEPAAHRRRRILPLLISAAVAVLPAVTLQSAAHAAPSPNGEFDYAEALQSGLVLGYAAMIQGMVERFKAELPGSPRVLLTGGRGAFLKELLPQLVAEVDPELTLRGIALLRARRGPLSSLIPRPPTRDHRS